MLRVGADTSIRHEVGQNALIDSPIDGPEPEVVGSTGGDVEGKNAVHPSLSGIRNKNR